MIPNFSVPKELYSQINEYDLQKPKVISPTKPRNVSNFPKAGIPEQLVPASVLPKERLLNIIETLNNQQTDSYYHDYRSIETEYQDYKILITKKANKYWFALWFNTNSESPVFSYSICFRNLKSYRDYRRGAIWSEFNVEEQDFTIVKHTKKDYLYLHKSVLKEDLINRTFESRRILIDSRKEVFFNAFRHRVSKYIFIWNNYGVFEAYNTSMASLVGCHHKSKDFSWIPDYKFIISKLNVSPAFKEKLDTPFFRKKLNYICQQFINYYQSVDFDRYKSKFDYKFIEIMDSVDKLYGSEISVDYLQQMWSDLEFDIDADKYKYCYFYSTTPVTQEWFKENVPVKSLINMFCKDHRITTDTISMIGDILKKNSDLKYTGRWRAQEFHDFIMAEQWKLCNKNEKLPQDLFPSPVKVDKMTFIQPINTHQLSSWGRAARNCVGSSTYSNGILKKNHFIILSLKENQPYLTIQARLENEQLRIVQVKKTCNAGLTPFEEQECHQAFGKALMIRAQEVAASEVQ
jgi:hypothetical protein